MRFRAREQRELDLIEEEIAASDAELASLLAMFARLAAGEELPAREQLWARRRPSGRQLGAGLEAPGGASTRLGLFAALLWLAVSLALIASILATGRGAGGKGCAAPGITCAGQTSAHQPRSARVPALG